jgi:hypothetical protein
MLVEIAHIISLCDDLINDEGLSMSQAEKAKEIRETCLNLLNIAEGGTK